MGRDKLLLEYKGKSLLQHSIDLLSVLPVFERILVTSESRIEFVSIPQDMTVRTNPVPETGQSGSIRIGIEASSGSHYFFLTADQPKLKERDLVPLLKAAEANPDKIIFPLINSTPCSPTLFPVNFREELMVLSGDAGGRLVRDANKKSCFPVKPEETMNYTDIDNMEDYYELIES